MLPAWRRRRRSRPPGHRRQRRQVDRTAVGVELQRVLPAHRDRHRRQVREPHGSAARRRHEVRAHPGGPVVKGVAERSHRRRVDDRACSRRVERIGTVRPVEPRRRVVDRLAARQLQSPSVVGLEFRRPRGGQRRQGDVSSRLRDEDGVAGPPGHRRQRRQVDRTAVDVELQRVLPAHRHRHRRQVREPHGSAGRRRHEVRAHPGGPVVKGVAERSHRRRVDDRARSRRVKRIGTIRPVEPRRRVVDRLAARQFQSPSVVGVERRRSWRRQRRQGERAPSLGDEDGVAGAPRHRRQRRQVDRAAVGIKLQRVLPAHRHRHRGQVREPHGSAGRRRHEVRAHPEGPVVERVAEGTHRRRVDDRACSRRVERMGTVRPVEPRRRVVDRLAARQFQSPSVVGVERRRSWRRQRRQGERAPTLRHENGVSGAPGHRRQRRQVDRTAVDVELQRVLAAHRDRHRGQVRQPHGPAALRPDEVRARPDAPVVERVAGAQQPGQVEDRPRAGGAEQRRRPGEAGRGVGRGVKGRVPGRTHVGACASAREARCRRQERSPRIVDDPRDARVSTDAVGVPDPDPERDVVRDRHGGDRARRDVHRDRVGSRRKRDVVRPARHGAHVPLRRIGVVAGRAVPRAGVAARARPASTETAITLVVDRETVTMIPPSVRRKTRTGCVCLYASRRGPNKRRPIRFARGLQPVVPARSSQTVG